MVKTLVIKARFGMDLSLHYEDISKFSGQCYFEDNKITVVGEDRELASCIDVTKKRYGRSHINVVNAEPEVLCTII